MPPRRSASYAIWFLTTFGSGPSIDALGGDLAEEYQRGKSAAWLWRQSVAGILVSFLSEVRAHPIIAGRSVLLWGVVSTVLFVGVAPLIERLNSLALQRMSLWVYTQWQVFSLVVAAASFVVALLGGWTVAVLHRRHRAMAIWSVVVVAVTVSLLDPELHRLIGNALTHQRYWRYLSARVLIVAAVPVGLLLGGFSFGPLTGIARARRHSG